MLELTIQQCQKVNGGMTVERAGEIGGGITGGMVGAFLASFIAIPVGLIIVFSEYGALKDAIIYSGMIYAAGIFVGASTGIIMGYFAGLTADAMSQTMQKRPS